ncbi:MAG: hypothetical protein J5822_09605 [Eubacteriaceae bacterium]|nr:hypothetical protein [Eubacteriaceae bacterium]
MIPAKRNGFLLFIASLIPGAAQMYMGYMKNGISLMAVFLAAAAAAGNLRGLAFMAGAALIVWFYSFFHARNLAAADDEFIEQYRDRYFWEELAEEGGFVLTGERSRKIFAGALILFGGMVMWGYVSDLIYYMLPDEVWEGMYRIISRIPELVISALLIAGGIRLMKTRKADLTGEDFGTAGDPGSPQGSEEQK